MLLLLCKSAVVLFLLSKIAYDAFIIVLLRYYCWAWFCGWLGGRWFGFSPSRLFNAFFFVPRAKTMFFCHVSILIVSWFPRDWKRWNGKLFSISMDSDWSIFLSFLLSSHPHNTVLSLNRSARKRVYAPSRTFSMYQLQTPKFWSILGPRTNLIGK